MVASRCRCHLVALRWCLASFVTLVYLCVGYKLPSFKSWTRSVEETNQEITTVTKNESSGSLPQRRLMNATSSLDTWNQTSIESLRIVAFGTSRTYGPEVSAMIEDYKIFLWLSTFVVCEMFCVIGAICC